MDTDQLLAFARVVREGSFSRAARTLDIGQPAVSARIQALEAQLGGALLTRGRRIGLTPLGAGFLPFAERALEALDEGKRHARLSQSGDRGRVTLACLGSLAGDLLGPALASFLRARPGVECSMRSGDHEFVLQLLADGVFAIEVDNGQRQSAAGLNFHAGFLGSGQDKAGRNREDEGNGKG